MFSLIRCFVLAKSLSIHDQFCLGKTKLSDSRSLFNIVNWIVLMENQSRSSGKFPRTHNTAVTSGNPKERCRKTKYCLNSSNIESFLMSMYNDIHWRKAGNKENCSSNSSDVAYAKRFPEGHSSFFGPGTAEKGTERTSVNQTVRGTMLPI